MLGMFVTFQYDSEFDRERVIGIASGARDTFEGMPGLRNKFFTVDADKRRAVNFYVWEWEDTGLEFFTDELRARVTELYGTAPSIEFVEIVELVDNSKDSIE